MRLEKLRMELTDKLTGLWEQYSDRRQGGVGQKKVVEDI